MGIVYGPQQRWANSETSDTGSDSDMGSDTDFGLGQGFGHEFGHELILVLNGCK